MLLRLSSARNGRRRAASVAALAAMAVAVGGCQVATARPRTSPARPSPPATSGHALAQPVLRPTAHARIMIVGDSITQGSSGDYTWQYRLYKHLLADGVRPTMVGPYGWLFNNVKGVQRDNSYADPNFEHANDAAWGMALFKEKNVIGAKVARYRPDYLLVVLGLNDLFWIGLSQPVMAANLASFIAAARAARPGIRIVLGLIPPDIHQQTNPVFAASVASYNRTIISTASRLSTRKSPIAVAHDGAGINVAADLWDGTHPNANGEIKMAAGFADVLASRFHLGDAYPRPFPVLPTGPLTHPHLAVRTAKPGQAVLSWTHSPGAGSYFIYLRDVTSGDAGFTRLPLPLPVAKDPWTAGLLTPGHTYEFKVQACKGADCNAFSNVASVTNP